MVLYRFIIQISLEGTGGYRRTDRQPGTQIDIQRSRQASKKKDRQTHRQIDRQATDRHTDRQIDSQRDMYIWPNPKTAKTKQNQAKTSKNNKKTDKTTGPLKTVKPL